MRWAGLHFCTRDGCHPPNSEALQSPATCDRLPNPNGVVAFSCASARLATARLPQPLWGWNLMRFNPGWLPLRDPGLGGAIPLGLKPFALFRLPIPDRDPGFWRCSIWRFICVYLRHLRLNSPSTFVCFSAAETSSAWDSWGERGNRAHWAGLHFCTRDGCHPPKRRKFTRGGQCTSPGTETNHGQSCWTRRAASNQPRREAHSLLPQQLQAMGMGGVVG